MAPHVARGEDMTWIDPAHSPTRVAQSTTVCGRFRTKVASWSPFVVGDCFDVIIPGLARIEAEASRSPYRLAESQVAFDVVGGKGVDRHAILNTPPLRKMKTFSWVPSSLVGPVGGEVPATIEGEAVLARRAGRT